MEGIITDELKEEWKITLGKRMREFRNSLKLSVRKVSLATGVPERNIERIENGDGGGIRLFEALQLASVYGKSLDEISGLTSEEEIQDIDWAAMALKSFSPGLRQHHIFILRAIQNQLEMQKRWQGESLDPWKEK